MCKNLSLDEKKQAFELFTKEDNKNIFLATLNGDKPMALLAEYKPYNVPGDSSLGILKKLDLGKNFEWFDARFFEISGNRAWSLYFVNKSKTLETIARNKEIYTTGLGLSSNTSKKDVYKTLFDLCKKNEGVMPDDLLGITLGFPKYDTLIFNLEGTGKICSQRMSPDYSKMLLEVLKSDVSPYKNLSKTEMNALENAIKNITQQKLKDIAMKGSYHDGLYAFINFCDDPKELQRVSNSTKNFKQTFGINN